MRTLGVAAASALATAATAACSPLPIACPAIGDASTLTVTLAEPRDDVTLELCVTEGCEPIALEDLASEGIGFGGDGDGVAGWTVDPSPEAVVGYRLLAADGAVVADRDSHHGSSRGSLRSHLEERSCGASPVLSA